jgi:hypothetical protein
MRMGLEVTSSHWRIKYETTRLSKGQSKHCTEFTKFSSLPAVYYSKFQASLITKQAIYEGVQIQNLYNTSDLFTVNKMKTKTKAPNKA